MEFNMEKEFKNETMSSKIFKASSPLDLGSIISIAKNYVNDKNKMYKAMVSSYDEEGTYGTDTFTLMDDLYKLQDYPNPDIGIRVFYTDTVTSKYSFHMDASVNSNYVVFETNQKIADIINKEIERNKMLEEEKKSREVDINSNDKQY